LIDFGDKSRQDVQLPHAERQGEELVIRDGEKFVMIKNTTTRCPDCCGRGFRFWGGRARERETCELCGGTGVLTPLL
jgi:DnaJ-class molecular chaperone